MANAHYKGPSKEIKKRGLTVHVKRIYSEDSSSFDEKQSREFERAIRTLKRVTNQEGMTKDLRRKEYHETRGQIRRRKKGEAVRREMKNRRLSEW